MAELELDTLESKGLIRLATIQPELEYLFRHALVQDAAYESLLKQERRSLHRLVGGALEELYPDRGGELAAVLAHHFEQAGEHDKAVEYLLAAAEFAMARNAIVEAYDLLSRAEATLPAAAPDEDPAQRRRRLVVRFGRVKTGFSFLGDEETFAMIGPLGAEAEALGDLRLAADIQLHEALLRMYHGERPETSTVLTELLERVEQIAVELNDPVVSALPKSIIGLFQVFTGDLRAGVVTLQEAAPLLEQRHDFVGSSFALMALGIGLARLGRFDEAKAAAQRATDVAEGGDVIAKIDALIGEAGVRTTMGDFEGAVPLAERCGEMAMASGATACIVASSMVLGEALMRQGQFGDARIVLERSGTIAEVTHQSMFRPSINAYLRSAAASLGDFRPAGLTFDEALVEARAIRDRWGETHVLWKRAETEAKKPDPDREQVLADYAAAAAGFEAMGARPYLARALQDWGNALRTMGRPAEGQEKIRAALELFDELGLVTEADALREQLATSQN